MSTTNSSSRKRSSSAQVEEPTKRRAEEEKEKKNPEIVLLSGDSDDEVDKLPSDLKWWDNIGTEEEKYLESTRKELHDLIMNKKTFDSRVDEKSVEKLEELTESLYTYGKENIEELQILESDQTECEVQERSSKGRFISLISFQHRRFRWLMEEVFWRCHDRKSQISKKTAKIKTLKEENGNLRKSLEKVSRELEKLQKGLVSREMSKRDAAVETEIVPTVIVSTKSVSTETTSMETEIPEVEMRDEQTLSTSQGIPQSVARTLEEVIERKMGEILSRVGFPMEGKSKGWKGSEKSKTQTSTGDANTWSEVVKRSRGKPPTQGEAISSNGEIAREEPKGRKKKKKREWPLPPKTAAVVLTAPKGKEGACSEFLKRAMREISIEEMEIPPMEIKRSRTGGIILGVPGRDSQEKADTKKHT